MALLVGHSGIRGGVRWQVTQPGDPEVLTMVFPEQVATDAAVPDVSLPEVFGQDAWTLDFDAVRAHLESQSFSHFPAWVRGRVSATPSEVGPSVRFDITPENFRVSGTQVGPPAPQEVARDVARDLAQLASDLNRTKGDARHWLQGSEYAALKHRLEAAHAAVEAALIEARRRVRLNDERGG